MKRKIRILIAKPGLDGHDRGAKIVAKALSDGGIEVVYTGLHQTAREIVVAAIQEGVDGIGLSILSGAHMTHMKNVLKFLKESKAENIFVFGGGTIPEHDISKLREIGIAEIFTPGTKLSEIVNFVFQKNKDMSQG